MLQRLLMTTAQRVARTWDLFDLLFDTTTNEYWLGDAFTPGGIWLGAGVPTAALDVYVDAAAWDGATGQLTLTDTDAGTPDVGVNLGMVGATAFAAGVGGTVPAPPLGATSLFLRSDGAWAAGSQNIGETDQALTGNRTLTNSGAGHNFLVDILENGGPGRAFINLDAAGSEALIESTDGTNISGVQTDPSGVYLSHFNGADTAALSLASGDVLLGFGPTGRLRINGNGGTAGQVLRSQGLVGPPVWSNETVESFGLIGGELRFVGSNGVNQNTTLASLISADPGNALGVGADLRFFSAAPVNETYSLVAGGTLRFVGQSGANQDIQVGNLRSTDAGNDLGMGADGLLFLQETNETFGLVGSSLRFVGASGVAQSVPTANLVSGDVGNDLTVGGDGLLFLNAPTDTNYTTVDLTATANRSHDWDTFNLVENFLGGGTQRRVFGDLGITGNQVVVDETDRIWSVTQTDGALTDILEVGVGTTRFVQDDGLGLSGFSLLNGLNILSVPSMPLLLNGGAGTNGQVITSNASGVASWQPLPANTNYANTALTATAPRTHTWGAFDLTEAFTTGTRAFTYSGAGAEHLVSINGTGQSSSNVIDGAESSIVVQTAQAWGSTTANAPFSGNITVEATSTRAGCISGLGDGFSAQLILLPASAQLGYNDGATGTLVRCTQTTIELAFGVNGELLINGNAGLPGQVLTSNGPGAPPTWV